MVLVLCEMSRRPIEISHYHYLISSPMLIQRQKREVKLIPFSLLSHYQLRLTPRPSFPTDPLYCFLLLSPSEAYLANCVNYFYDPHDPSLYPVYPAFLWFW